MSSPVPFFPISAPPTPMAPPSELSGGCREISRPGTPRPPPRAPSPPAAAAASEKPNVSRRTLKHIMKTAGSFMTDDPAEALDALDEIIDEVQEISDSAPDYDPVLTVLSDLHGMRILVLLLVERPFEDESEIADVLQDVCAGVSSAYERLVAAVNVV